MKFCKRCGAQIMDEAVICPKCGCATGDANPYQNSGYPAPSYNRPNPNEPANAGLVILSILFPIVGIIMGIVFLCQGKKHAGTVYLVSAIVAWVVAFVILMACGGIMGAM